ncbi:MAG: metallophosphoesterase [Planctomycetes bacterium]|nr:metallophosphoesterase [Planctomycetota bacterium]
MPQRDYLRAKSLFETATRANLTDKHRSGALVQLPAEGDLLVLGDLHGNRENYSRVVEAARLNGNPKRHLVIQEIAHVLEVGVDTSFDLIEEAAGLKIRFPDQVHFLMGNHEYAELVGEEIMKGGVCLNIIFKEAIKRKYGEHYEEARQDLSRFLQTWPLAIRTETRLFFSHSTPETESIQHFTLDFFRNRNENFYEDGDLIYSLLWSRDYAQEGADEFARRMDADVLVVGHTACKNGFSMPSKRHVIIDSKDRNGCFLHVKLDRPYTAAEVARAVKRIFPERERQAMAETQEAEAEVGE